MIGTLLRIGFINLRRDRVVQALTFLLPIMFFSIFAMIFGNQRSPMHKVRVALVDEDGSAYSHRIAQALGREGGLHLQTTVKDDGTGAVLTRASAEELVHAGTLPVAIVLPKGLGAAPQMFGPRDPHQPAVQILADVSDPVAPQVVQGLLEKVSFTAAPEMMAASGISTFERYSGPLTPEQRHSVDQWMTQLRQPPAPGAAPADNGPSMGMPTEIVNVMQRGQTDTSTISFYAAGIGVMFLLFSSSGAGGALLEEEESGTLGRLISSPLGMTGVLAGKWLFLSITGMLQLTVMFCWGALVFHLPLASHLPGFVVMTAITAAAAAAFGILLATISRSRQQLSGISTIIILAMSAVGGSMFPRFLMSETMQKFGLLTFNAWALDGYLKVFWREEPILHLWPQVGVLLALTMIFLAGARFFARRWESL